MHLHMLGRHIYSGCFNLQKKEDIDNNSRKAETKTASVDVKWKLRSEYSSLNEKKSKATWQQCTYKSFFLNHKWTNKYIHYELHDDT